MLYTDSTTTQFIQDHLQSDPNKLLLSAKKYPQIQDMNYVVDQILGKRQLKEKLPLFYENPGIVIPSRLAAEQCSSYHTAQYKQRLLKGESLCDLTGGFGVDSYFFAQKTKQSFYIERFEAYCEAARHNFKTLHIDHIQVLQGDCRELVLPEVDTYYIDPARRSDSNQRLFSAQDCEPNIVELRSKLLTQCQRVVVKLSPMADIKQTLNQLPETIEVHILAVKNECKELLFVLEPHGSLNALEVPFYCVNYTSTGEEQCFEFTLGAENEILSPTVSPETLTQMHYIYEPHVSILKAGAFKSIAQHYKLYKAQASSHLYLSEEPVHSFPGRSFKIQEILPFSSKTNKTLHKSLAKANITARNFPITVEDLRKKLKISEGGETYIFATTLYHNEKVLVISQRLH